MLCMPGILFANLICKVTREGREGKTQVFERLDKEQTKKKESKMHRIQTKKAQNDVSEIYSPPRVTSVAEATGLRAGWALDLTVNQDDGTPLDLSTKSKQDKARKLQQEQAPHLPIASPMCAAVSALQGLNYN